MGYAFSTVSKVIKLSREVWSGIKGLLSYGSGKRNLVVGKPEVGDILLYSEQKSERGCVDHVFQYRGDVTITAVVAKDNWNNDTGAYPEIISGGPGHKHVEVKVASRSYRGFDYTIEVYGKKKKIQ